MVHNYAVVILNRYPEYARRFLSTVRQLHKQTPDILAVCDRHTEDLGVQSICTTDDFIYARNANRGIAAFPASDIVLCNDDMECVEEDFFHRLVSAARKYPRCGILSPLIDGGVGNPMQKYPPIDQWAAMPVDTVAIQGERPDSYPVCFPCVFLSRRMIDQIGPLDEQFTGYGGDDNDYCIRARKAGFYTMITRSLRIRHGRGGPYLDRGANWSLSFAREPDRPSNDEYLLRKHT